MNGEGARRQQLRSHHLLTQHICCSQQVSPLQLKKKTNLNAAYENVLCCLCWCWCCWCSCACFTREDMENNSKREIPIPAIIIAHAPTATTINKPTPPLDVSNMDIVFRGRAWSYPEDPTSKSMIPLLERNESIVTWLQPKGWKVEDQIPAINVNGQYRGITLRMQKSIWRHVRLKKGFINLESLSQVR